MNDMSSTIIAKSDQINAADLIGAPRTIVIKEVRIKAGDDQPVSVMIEGDKKAFRPCKGVRRLMVRVWGADASKYIGEAMTLFYDPSVTWAGKEEGGIRVSHMTGLKERIVEFMRTSRAATKPYEILPLRSGPTNPGQSTDKVADGVRDLIERIRAGEDVSADPAVQKQRTWLADKRPELAAEVDAAIAAQTDDDPFGEGPTLSDRGETNNLDPDELIAKIRECQSEKAVTLLMRMHSDQIGDLPEEDRTRIAEAQDETVLAIRGRG